MTSHNRPPSTPIRYNLALETSSAVASVAIGNNQGTCLSYAQSKTQGAHAEALFEMIEACLSEAACSWEEIALIACGSGPGSFTGLRMSAATIKGLCFRSEIDFISRSSLELIAQSYVDSLPNSSQSASVMVLLESYQASAYMAVYNYDGTSLEKKIAPCLISQDEIHSQITHVWKESGQADHIHLCGQPSMFEHINHTHIHISNAHPYPSARTLSKHAYHWLESSGPLDVESFVPEYQQAVKVTASKKLPPVPTIVEAPSSTSSNG